MGVDPLEVGIERAKQSDPAAAFEIVNRHEKISNSARLAVPATALGTTREATIGTMRLLCAAACATRVTHTPMQTESGVSTKTKLSAPLIAP